MSTIFDFSREGQSAFSLPKNEEAFQKFIPESSLCRSSPIDLPEVSELDLMRHFCKLSHKNVGIDNTFYPLGSCTMKYNPRICEEVAALSGFTSSHPLSPPHLVQGSLEIIYELIEMLCDICGMNAGTLLPNAGAQGEFIGLRLIEAYHQSKGENRTEILIPDSAHGTNPATASLAGYKTITLPSNSQGGIDLEALKKGVSNKTAALMLTNPSTLGLFVGDILEISKIVHEVGGLLYYDGANLNPLLYFIKPFDMGFDVVHLNLHKTFATPHGGGGPGSAPVLCSKKLAPFLPLPKVIKKEAYEVIWEDAQSIGNIASFFGNFAIYLRAYLYIKLHGKWGLRKIAEQATLNANYLKVKIKNLFTDPFPIPCMHEFVLQADQFGDVKAIDIAKRLLDYGVHAPTIYFPLIVKESLLIEPTETESKATLDHFVSIIQKIVSEIKSDSQILKNSPHTTSVSRLNEVEAARNPVLKKM